MGNRHEKVEAALVNKSFGERLTFLRRISKRTQGDLGRLVSLSRGTISNIESGIQNVQLHQVFAFSLALDVPVAELLPLLKDVVVNDGSFFSADVLFLELAKRQLVDLNASGDDDENT